MPNCSLKKYNKTITNIIIIIKTSGLNFTLWCFRIVTTLLTVPQWFCYSSIHTYHWLKERWVFYVSWDLVPWIQHTVRCLERIPARISSLKATRKQVNIQLTSYRVGQRQERYPVISPPTCASHHQEYISWYLSKGKVSKKNSFTLILQWNLRK